MAETADMQTDAEIAGHRYGGSAIVVKLVATSLHHVCVCACARVYIYIYIYINYT
jgi:hypothetical protein